MLRRLRMSLRLKVMLLVLATTIFALFVSAAALVIYDARAYQTNWTRDLELQAEILARASAPALVFNDPQAAAKDLALVRVRPRVLAAALYAADGHLFATYRRAGESVPPLPDKPGPEGFRVEGDQLLVFHPVIENGEPIGTVYLRTLYLPWERVRAYLAIIAVVMVASLLLAALVSVWLQSGITVPILEVARVAREVMQRRDYGLRARKTSEDEIGELVDAFNGMLAEAGRRAEALREADRRKDEFLATLAHELRNPLAPLRNAVQILRSPKANTEMTQRALDMMERQLRQMVRLVDDLLDVSRITTGKLAVRKQFIDLHGVLEDAVETVRPFIESRQHRLELRIAPEPLTVLGDGTRLAQVFGNLLHNAAKYTEPGGVITLAARREAGNVVVRVSDTGIGLDPRSIATIFEMFVQVDRSLTRAQAGLGVGLTLARRLIALHEGTVTACSEGAGKGSEFVVRIPAAEPGQGGAAAKPTIEQEESPSLRILLADDNVDFANSLASLLAARGHDVRVAHDGAEALRAVEEFTPDFVFLDIGMPKVHGYEVARRLREKPALADSVLVALTGWGQEDDRRRVQEAGFDRHLVKPVDPVDIEAILRES